MAWPRRRSSSARLCPEVSESWYPKVCRLCGIPHKRHTYAVELERAGVPVSQISKLLGHSSIAVTSRYLDHLSNAAAIEALEAVELPALDV